MKSIGMSFMPGFYALDWSLTAELRLGQVRVVEGDIPVQGLLQIQGRIEVMGLEDIGDAAVEALDHAVGLRAPGWREAVFGALLIRPGED
jgi:hypothetical protein